MSGILEQMVQPRQFTPSNADEYLALQIARKLNDEISVMRYVHYMSHYAMDHLLRLCHKAKQEPDPARAFHSSLTK